MELTVAIISVVALIAATWALMHQGHPEDASDHEFHSDEASDDHEGPAEADYPTGARPAGPDAESQDPEGLHQ